MIVKRFFEDGLAQASYLIGCGASGRALVIDPHRDADFYVREAEEDQLRISDITETHIHADFLSGSRELAARTGATLHLSDEGDAVWKYAFANEGRLLKNGDEIEVGNVRVQAVHTPGHTPEHLTFLIIDGAVATVPIAAATGDFIFVGDVGRPDLLERAAHVENPARRSPNHDAALGPRTSLSGGTDAPTSQEDKRLRVSATMAESARTLYRALHAFERGREDWLQLWPGHGAGSACGKGISAVPHTTLGYERRFNWAFKVPDEAAFVEQVLAGQPDPPTYFGTMKRLNKEGPQVLGAVPVPQRLDAKLLAEMLGQGALVADTRPADAYAAGHVPGTINIPFNRSFVTWAGWLMPYDRPFAVIASDDDPQRPREIARALALIGLDNLGGYFSPTGLNTSARVAQMEPAEFAAAIARGVTVLDVRNASEWAHGHVDGALHVPIGHLSNRLAEIPTDRPIVVHCQSGRRSAIAASILQRAGFKDVKNLRGGYAAWQESNRT